MNVTLHGNVAELVHKQTEIGNYESPEDLIYEALQVLIKQKIDNGIEEGLKDIEEGRYVEVTQENYKEVLSKPIDQW